VISSGQICQFDDMHVKSVVLDEIMKDPENPREDFVFELEIKVGGGAGEWLCWVCIDRMRTGDRGVGVGVWRCTRGWGEKYSKMNAGNNMSRFASQFATQEQRLCDAI